MTKLVGFQRTYLRGLAHALKPVVIVGQRGLTEGLLTSISEALDQHELIKVRFNEHKEEKKQLIGEIETSTGCESVGLVGHTTILYRQHPEPDKRKIVVPRRQQS